MKTVLRPVWWIAILSAALSGAPAAAQDVGARAYLNRNEVGINQQFVLSVEISGTQQVESDPVLPDLEEFSIFLGSSTSTSMQIINGRTTVSVTLQYRFQATKEGTFEIGSVEVRAGGRTVRTESVTIVVTADPAPSQPGLTEPGGDTEISPDDLFVAVEVSKDRVYEHEPVVVEYRIYTRLEVTSYSVVRMPGTAGFWVEEFPQPPAPQIERVVRNGVQYATAVIRKVAMFPTGPGTKTIEPMSIEAQVRVQRRSLDPFENFFRTPSLFGSRVPVVAASQPREIAVSPLPERGKPRGFSGLVGDLAVTASVDKTQAAMNEALTFRVTVAGEGNLRAVTAPAISFPSEFEVYPPDVSEQIDRSDNRVGGSKVFEYVLIPRAPGSVTIPSVQVAYFDVNRRSYATAASQPIAVTVAGEAVAGPMIAGRSRGGIEQLREDIRFIRIAQPKFRSRDGSLFSEAGFWIVLLLPVVAVGGAWGLRRYRDRLAGDVAYARRRRAGRLARKRLSRARSLRSPDTHREFYAELGRALQGFIGDKLNLAEAGLIKEAVHSQFSARGVSAEVASEYLACVEICDRQRFAPSQPNVTEMNAFLERVERAMTDLDQELTG